MAILRKVERLLLNIFGFYCIILSPVNIAQPNSGSSLEDFFNAAIKFSPTLQIAAENLNISSARKKAAVGQLLPQINAGANVSDNNADQFNVTRNFTGERYFLSLSQTLFNWQQFSLRKEARLLEDQSEEEYYYQLAVLLTEVAERYFGVLQARDSIDLISSEIEALRNQLDQVQNLFDRQLAQVTDLYQVEASLAASEAQQLQLEADLAISRERLSSISGLEVGTLLQLREDIEISPLEYDQAFYVQKAQESNNRVLAGEFAVKAANEGVSGRRGAYMPQVSLIAQRQDSNVGFENLPINRTDNTYIGFNVVIPIYAGGRNRASVSEAISRRSIAEYELRETQLRTRELVRSAFLQVKASDAQSDAASILVESTALSSEAMQQGFSLGTVTSVDVLNALRDQFQAERDLQRIRYDHIRYLLLLKRETGTLDAEDMLEVGSWLEPSSP